MTDPRCTCPRPVNDRGEAQYYLDQACPVCNKQPHCCPTCGNPIVQTPDVAREMAERGKERG